MNKNSQEDKTCREQKKVSGDKYNTVFFREGEKNILLNLVLSTGVI